MTPSESPHLIARTSLSDAVYERLHDEIIHGQIPDGSKISQVDLAARYGVSRIPVREALRRLQAESLVVATPYHPFVVRNITAAQVLELVDVRAVLEDLALASRQPPPADVIAKLRQMNEQMAGADGDQFLNADREFHHLIAGPDTMTVEILDEVRRKIRKYLSVMVHARPGRTTATREHAKIIDALAAMDMGLARQLVHEHVMRSRAFIAGRLEAEAAEAGAAEAGAAEAEAAEAEAAESQTAG